MQESDLFTSSLDSYRRETRNATFAREAKNDDSTRSTAKSGRHHYRNLELEFRPCLLPFCRRDLFGTDFCAQSSKLKDREEKLLQV